ncbi:hypothetical protein IAU60_004480 [Kwoniella sp. DSM 27419]
MAVRFRNATPGTLMCLIATALLAVVSFNTPMLKSLKFLSASFSSGEYAGTLDLGTLGYCRTLNGAQSCVGPQVGYEFDPNAVFGVTLFDLPQAITKYLTYVLILHVVALGFAALATIFGLISHSPTFSSCFAIWMASIGSSIALIALVFDLAMFYIARARINSVSGASAEIGISVWLTLAAWIILALSGCFFGIGNCCGSCRTNDDGGDPKRGRGKYDRQDGEEDYKMRMMAIDNERQRKQRQEQGLPSFQELTPLKDDGEDKYMYESQPSQQQVPGGLRRDGSVLDNVGVGYGRRNRTPANDPYAAGGAAGNAGAWGQPAGYQNIAAPPLAARRLSDVTSAGDFVGVGAGGAGVEPPPQPDYSRSDQGYYGEHPYGAGSDQGQYGQGYQQHQMDPYAQQSYNDPYAQGQNHPHGQANQYADPYRSSSAQPYGTSYNAMPMAMPMAMPTPGVQARSPVSGGAQPNYDTSFNESSDSHYPDPGPQVNHADAYDGYDDGLGAIGMAATSGSGRHERDYTGQTFGGNEGYHQRQAPAAGGYSDSQMQYGGASQGGIQQPAPQHLVHPTQSSDLLRSPISPVAGGSRYDYTDEADVADSTPRPPSYSAGNYAAPGGSRGEKYQYRNL